MKIIEPRVSEKDARRFFERPRLRNLWGLLKLLKRSRPIEISSSRGRKLPYLELLYLPYYLIRFRVESFQEPGAIEVSVEAHSGAFAIFQMQDDLSERSETREWFQPKLSEAEAVEIGRRELVASILRRRGNREKPSVGEVLGIDFFYYPFWVWYFERREGLIDIALMDAARGVKGGDRTRVGVLSCLSSRAD
jgi:hypothetical protein